jgi:hypothetical protein
MIHSSALRGPSVEASKRVGLPPILAVWNLPAGDNVAPPAAKALLRQPIPRMKDIQATERTQSLLDRQNVTALIPRTKLISRPQIAYQRDRQTIS